MRPLLASVILVLPIAVRAQDDKPMSAKELAEFLGPVYRSRSHGKRHWGPDFDIYHGETNPPLAGNVNSYLGGHRQRVKPDPNWSTFERKLGIFAVQWHKRIAGDGSVTQRGLILLDDYCKVDISVHAPSQEK
jgi:hypothetical protein